MQFNKEFCKKFDIKYPIFQAGMGKTMGTPTTPELVYEVSNAGGVGFLGASGLTLEEIEKSVMEIKKNTDKPFGVAQQSIGDMFCQESQHKSQISILHGIGSAAR